MRGRRFVPNLKLDPKKDLSPGIGVTEERDSKEEPSSSQATAGDPSDGPFVQETLSSQQATSPPSPPIQLCSPNKSTLSEPELGPGPEPEPPVVEPRLVHKPLVRLVPPLVSLPSPSYLSLPTLSPAPRQYSQKKSNALLAVSGSSPSPLSLC